MPSHGDTRARPVAFTGVLLALASVLGLVETLMIPPLPVPGLRLGLANIAVVIAFAAVGPERALFVALGRVFVVGVATGSLLGPTSALSLAGASCAWLAMAAVHSRGEKFSCIGWSVAGSAANVVGQLLAAVALAGAAAPLVLLPLSLGLSLPSGLGVGFAARALLSRVSRPVVSFVG